MNKKDLELATEDIKMTRKNIMKELKDWYSFEEKGEILDFRTHVFLDNSYANYPTFSYDFAEHIIIFVFDFMHAIIENNKKHFPEFGGWEYNLMMSCEELRITKLKDFIDDKIDGLLTYYIDKPKEQRT